MKLSTMGRLHQARGGFTLIEMSIVLVIIGLIVSGILVGQHLIRAAEVRSTLTQIEHYNTAVNTFREKYGYLPGDIPSPPAAQFGLTARGPYAGMGDGNGVIEGVWCTHAACNSGLIESGGGENAVFWVDLSAAHLIDSSFSLASSVNPAWAIYGTITATTSPSLSAYMPPAKVGQVNSIYVYSNNNTNYFALSSPTQISSTNSALYSTPVLSVAEAFGVDTKIDDGLPQEGNVTAQYINGSEIRWAAGGSTYGVADTSPTPGSSITCYDNGNVSDATQHYSLEISNGNGVNCALSFRMQAGD